jgi:hypothetical protein
VFDSYPEDTPADADEPQDEQADQLQTLVNTVSQLRKDMDKRLSDKDREITHWRGQAQAYHGLVNATQPAEGTPATDPPPALDEETAALLAETAKEDPAKAWQQLANHMDRRSQLRQAASAQVANQQEQIKAAERNVMRQVELAIANYGDAAEEVVGDFNNLYRQGAAPGAFQGTWLGQQIMSDNSMAISPSAVYKAVELEVLRKHATAGQEIEQAPPVAPAGVMRPSAPDRSVRHNPVNDPNQPSIEDQIAEAIVNSARGEDAQARHILMGE